MTASSPAADAPQPELDSADAALAALLRGGDSGDGERLSRAALAERAGVPESLLEAMEREGLLQPGEDGYGEDDARVLAAGMELLAAGLPLAELLALARRHDEAMRAVAEEAVELFVRFVRDPIRGTAEDAEEAGRRMRDAFERMLPATSGLVAHHFRRTLLAAARERLRRETQAP
ncbi:MAG TPA: MerR family transcriptional regulator [Egibacteraceae bacterium]|nr:MerR family transcriptional regulator [Egibacteraceae bacterium]